jgi:hypothetical protein
LHCYSNGCGNAQISIFSNTIAASGPYQNKCLNCLSSDWAFDAAGFIVLAELLPTGARLYPLQLTEIPSNFMVTLVFYNYKYTWEKTIAGQ